MGQIVQGVDYLRPIQLSIHVQNKLDPQRSYFATQSTSVPDTLREQVHILNGKSCNMRRDEGDLQNIMQVVLIVWLG